MNTASEAGNQHTKPQFYEQASENYIKICANMQSNPSVNKPINYSKQCYIHYIVNMFLDVTS